MRCRRSSAKGYASDNGSSPILIVRPVLEINQLSLLQVEMTAFLLMRVLRSCFVDVCKLDLVLPLALFRKIVRCAIQHSYTQEISEMARQLTNSVRTAPHF